MKMYRKTLLAEELAGFDYRVSVTCHSSQDRSQYA